MDAEPARKGHAAARSLIGARQLATPLPLLAAVGAKTNCIEIGTAVIDMRHENPIYTTEDAGGPDAAHRA